MRSPFPTAHTFWAYTLVELLIALTLSLILLVGVTELFSRVSGTMSETRATLNLSANLDGAELLLRKDLAQIPGALTKKPVAIAACLADPGATEVEDSGYLEIVEGPDTALSHRFVDREGKPDPTVGDVDDILAFTAKADPATPFRGLIDGKIAERNYAEIIWFVRGNTLYRRVRLIDDQSPTDPSVNSITELALRQRRFGHHLGDPFPYLLYDASNLTAQYYLRMPTLEEYLYDPDTWSVENWRNTLSSVNPIPNPDLWEQPHFFPNDQDKKSGSLKAYISKPRHHRAGEDIVLTNVLSFDIKVWCPITRNFVDLGTPGTTWADSNSKQLELLRTWDSWSVEYKGELPPYTESLEAIQITIRCFDPASRVLKQVTVVHQF